jgi:hypothetical protein
MEYFNNKLCIKANWLIEEGIISESNYKQLTCGNEKSKRKPIIKVVRRGCLNTPAIIEFDSIPDRFKEKIKLKIGDVHAIVAKSQLAENIQTDNAARQYYSAYTFENGEHLPADVQREYCTNAEILNALSFILNNRSASRKTIGGDKVGMWSKLAKAVLNLDLTVFKHSLPTNDRRLQDKYKRYKAESYESLIHGNWCNKNSEKVNDEAKMWVLSRWTSMVNRVTGVAQLLVEYNEMAENYGWKLLKSENTLHLFLFSDEIKNLWWGSRYGELKFKEKFVYQHKTILPTMRDSLWYSDGTKLNYFYGYRDEKNRYKVGTTSVYEIMDVYSECLLGYFISDTEDYVAQYNAYRMALQTAGQKPYQITYDNQGGHKKLENGDFLTKLAHLSIPTRPYNGKSKTIESAFGRFQSQHLKKDWYFTGQNIQAKREESKVNMEFVTANRHNLPTKEEIAATYKMRRAEWNNAPHPQTGISRIKMYHESLNPKAVKLELMDMVELFWITREKPIQATAYGISFIEKGERYDYIVNDAAGMPDVRWIAQNIDRKFRIKYDPTDFDLIYLYEDTPQGLRFITAAEQKVEIHRGKQEQEAGEMEWFAKVEKASEELRIENDAHMREIQRQWNQLPEQNGLVTPKIKGINSKTQNPKTKGQADNFGRLQKAISNAVMANGDDDDFNETDLYNLM